MRAGREERKERKGSCKKKFKKLPLCLCVDSGAPRIRSRKVSEREREK